MRIRRIIILPALCLLLSACTTQQSETKIPETPSVQPGADSEAEVTPTGQPDDADNKNSESPSDGDTPSDGNQPSKTDPRTEKNDVQQGDNDENKPDGSDDPLQEGPVTKEDISGIIFNAISELTEEAQFNVAGISWDFGAENDLKNIYHAVLSEHPELKYAYDMAPTVSGDTAVCKFAYMPYKTGSYASGIPAGSHTVASLHDVRVMAQSMIDGTERLSIAITNPSLTVEDIQLALAQAGYGWIRFDLSRDGTEIIAQAPVGKTLAECVSAINESFRLGGEILARITTTDMTDREKIEAIYDYIAGNVSYDFRYYSDRANMPYESMVALGALRDNVAICGGFAQAFQTLLDMSGIRNYTVTGISKGENHMWNYVILDGTGYYCDPTADRGGMSNHFMLTDKELTALGGYSWNHEYLSKLSGTDK